MRVLLAPNAFKHSLSAAQVAAALAGGFRRLRWQVDSLPLADGGPGTLDAVHAAIGGRLQYARVKDALGRPCRAAWLKLSGRLAVIESAQAIGLERLGRRRDPLGASSAGLGQLLQAAAKAGCKEAWVGLGGSATTDGGLGMARALGLAAGAQPGTALRGMRLRVLCDVTAPLYGLRGAAHVFGPQKGANAKQVRLLDARLRGLAQLFGPALAERPGAGAAGGLGFGLMAFLGAKLVPGAAALMRLARFSERLRRADLVVTGEGSLDAQTLQGKLPMQVLAAARKAGKPCLLVAGRSTLTEAAWRKYGAAALITGVALAGSEAASIKKARAGLARAPKLFFDRL